MRKKQGCAEETSVNFKIRAEQSKRERRMSILLSENELQIINEYLKKNKITNKSRWLRETILASIHRDIEEHYPTLFTEHDMRR